MKSAHQRAKDKAAGVKTKRRDMENQSIDMEKEIGKLNVPRPKKRISRWTLLLVGDNGKIISVPQFKRVAIASVVVFLVVGAMAICFYILYGSKVKENLRLQDALETSRQNSIALEKEKDLMMVRLVLAESKNNSGRSPTEATAVEKTSKVPVGQGPSKTDKLEIAAPKIITEKNAAQIPADAKPPASTAAADSPGISEQPVADEKPRAVSVEKVIVQHDQQNNLIKATFLIRKEDPNLEMISGRAIVTLQDENADQKEWLTMPSASLISGKLSPVNKGQYFSIARFKPMKFELNYSADPSHFQYATIFIFSTTGELLLEKGFPIKVQKVLTTPAQ